MRHLTRAALLVSPLLVVTACSTRRPAPASPRPPATTVSRPGALTGGGSLRVETGPRGSGRIEVIPLEEYVSDVVVGEITVSASDGALAARVFEAQAIVARTYAAAQRGRHAAERFDLCSTTHCQVWRRGGARQSRWAAAIASAVVRSRGLVLTWADAPIEAVFHGHCGGHTSAASDVWRGGPAPYLQAVPDPYCLRERPARWTWQADIDGLRHAFNRVARTAVGTRLDAIQVVRRDAGGRVAEVLLSGDRAPVVSGEDLRMAVLGAFGAASLRSTHFDVRREGSLVLFEGDGWGHGVGLCQTGLLARVRAGQSALAILQAYYQGARVERLGGT